MSNSNKTAALLLLVLVVLFAVGLYALFVLRLETGDMFPASSSLRSDPLGAKAFYQALERMPGLSVQRHYRSLPKLTETGELTLFYIGLSPDFLTIARKDVLDKMEDMARGGARLVLSFQSGLKKPSGVKWKNALGKTSPKPSDDPEKPGGEVEKKARDEAEKSEIGVKPEPEISAEKRWKVSAGYSEISKTVKENRPMASLKVPIDGLPAAFSLHTALYFQNPGDDWRILYSAEERPVLIEHTLGDGSIILMADSYLFSNEAMLRERHPRLLSWFVGSSPLVVFNEFHLGVRENPGIMSLIRKYRLHGFLAGLILLAGLFVWQNAVPFIPARNPDAGKELNSAAGIHQLDGLINLLKRNIQPGGLLKICFEEWEKSAGQSSRGIQEKIQQARSIVDTAGGKGSHRDAAKSYAEISNLLSVRSEPVK
ncbi:MAG: DUF4350 domain-containing protein [Syntrophobacteraceae bacterium]